MIQTDFVSFLNLLNVLLYNPYGSVFYLHERGITKSPSEK